MNCLSIHPKEKRWICTLEYGHQGPHDWEAPNRKVHTSIAGLDSFPEPLSKQEQMAWDRAMKEVLNEAANNIHKRPKFTTLLEEMAELTLSLRGKHGHPAEIELMQVASTALNLLAQWYMGNRQHINNARTFHDEDDS